MLTRYAASQLKNNGPFLLGLVVGVYVALVAVPGERQACGVDLGEVPDVEPVSAAPAPLEPAVQRPRYYRSELGMREPVLAAVLSPSLSTRGVLLNASAAGVVPLRLFSAASERAPPAGNVVAFTDTRRMLQPFHMLKYLADNHLEQYNYFLLLDDTAALNARQLLRLAEEISVSQDVYMGAPAPDNTDYCMLESGILLSNSVLRSIHSSLDWCVRNSYSTHHYENVGRCVLHSARVTCMRQVQDRKYKWASHPREGSPWPSLVDVVAVVTGTSEVRMRTALEIMCRQLLEKTQQEISQYSTQLSRLLPHHPPHFRNHSWPTGARVDAGMLPPTPIDRFDDLRWTWFNRTHAMMYNDHEPVTLLPPIYARAVEEALEEVSNWLQDKYGDREMTLTEGLWRWVPAQGLFYRLRVETALGPRLLELCRILGSASVLPVPYVTESTTVRILLPALAGHERRIFQLAERIMRDKPRAVALTVLRLSREAAAPPGDLLTYDREEVRDAGSTSYWAALRWAVSRLPRDSLILLAHHDMEYNDDFLNRVRMNTIRGHQWFAPLPLLRPVLSPSRGKFGPAGLVLSFYRTDLEAAYGAIPTSPYEALRRSRLVLLSSPEPALVLVPPSAADLSRCSRDVRCSESLYFGERQAVATMLLQDGALA